MKKRILLSAPHMSGNEIQYIQNVFESNHIAPFGEYLDRFEESIKKYTGTQNALGVISGTAAMHLALRVLGIGRSDEVLVSTFTFIGSVNAVLYQGASPVFIDSDQESWNLSPKLLNKYLCSRAKKPKALIVTHIFGQCANIEKIARICALHGVYLIEDAAESLGATYDGKHAGTFGDFGVYSFNGNKIITTSGGGMLVSRNKEWIEKALFYATQAKEPFAHYEHTRYGYNYRMSNVLAAIGVGQMEVIEERVAKKREIYDCYREFLGDKKEITFMPELPQSRGNRWLTTVTFAKTNYNKVMNALEKNSIESRPFFKPMHMQPLFKNAKSIVDGTSEALFSQGLCLPSSTTMSRNDIAEISEIVRAILEK